MNNKDKLALCLAGMTLVAMGAMAEARAQTAPDEQKLFDHPEAIPALLKEKKLAPPRIPSPHWRSDACRACHAETPDRGAAKLRTSDINRLCGACHDGMSQSYLIHPIGMAVPTAMRSRAPEPMQAALARGGGVITCITCHDLPVQCLRERTRERALNSAFLRGWPYPARADLCAFCHDPRHYTRLNPHAPVEGEGARDQEGCLLCHGDTRGLETARGINEVNFIPARDLSALCTRCHPNLPHPGGDFTFSGKKIPNHLVAPSPEMLAYMKQMGSKNRGVLPLDPGTGRIFCGTCHYSHAPGVLRSEAAAKSANHEHRLRTSNICLDCHAK